VKVTTIILAAAPLSRPVVMTGSLQLGANERHGGPPRDNVMIERESETLVGLPMHMLDAMLSRRSPEVANLQERDAAFN
jgi:hypothetical protein